MKSSLLFFALGAAAGLFAYKKIESSGADDKMMSAIEKKIDEMQSKSE